MADGADAQETFEEVVSRAVDFVEIFGGTVFNCEACAAIFVHSENGAIFASPGVEIHSMTHTASCPECGQIMVPVAPTTIETDADGNTFAHNAVSEKHAAQIKAAIDAVGLLRDDASADEIADVLEAQGLHPIADYFRTNHLELAGLGINLAALVFAVLMWLHPRTEDEPLPPPPPPPQGVTYEQMNQLINDLESKIAQQSPDDQQTGSDDKKTPQEPQGPRGGDPADKEPK